jgi:hypothetical protein
MRSPISQMDNAVYPPASPHGVFSTSLEMTRRTVAITCHPMPETLDAGHLSALLEGVPFVSHGSERFLDFASNDKRKVTRENLRIRCRADFVSFSRTVNHAGKVAKVR